MPHSPDSARPTAFPPYPGDAPAYPGDAFTHPGDEPPYPGDAPAYPGDEPPYPGDAPSYPTSPAAPAPAPAPVPVPLVDQPARPAATPVPPPPPPPPLPPPRPPFAPSPPPAAPSAPPPPPPLDPPHTSPAATNDLHFHSGRAYLQTFQRGADKAALAQLVAALPTALISLFVVTVVTVMVDPVLGTVLPLLWLGSGALVFHPSTEQLIARRMGLREPAPAEWHRLSVVWKEVAYRAGVDPTRYQLWVQDQPELNSTATAGHIVGVTRLALERLTDAQLAAILAHELGHHVGGHTWAALLADWYGLPARTVARAAVRAVSGLFGSRHPVGVGCGCLLVAVLPLFLLDLLDLEHVWWLLLTAALAPVFTTLLRRRAEEKADDYAVVLRFGTELAAVLFQERHRLRTEGPAPAAPPRSPPPPPGWAPGWPPGPPPPPAWSPGGHPPPPPPAPPASPPPRTPHTDLEARLHRLAAFLPPEAAAALATDRGTPGTPETPPR